MKNIYRSAGICLLLLLCSCEGKIPPLSSNATVLTFGGSLTAGEVGKVDESYPVALSSMTKRKVINGGVSGELAKDALSRLPALLDKHNPELVIICHGLNDFVQELPYKQIEANLRDMIRLAQARDVPILLLGVPDPKIFIKSVDMYKKIARDTGVFFLEDIISDVLARPAMNSAVGLPNKMGNMVIATEVLNMLKKMKSI